jgi:tetratricopeptide (TPR) repeat protein
LGKLQLRDQDTSSAQHSFDQALAADPKYVNPYVGLAQLAMRSKNWSKVIEVTGKLLALDPISFPDAYFYSSVANYSLGNFDAAERSALQGVKVDDAHQIPRLQYLLGVILLQKKDYQAASEHMQLYLRLSTSPVDVDLAKKGLAEIEKLSASANPSVVDQGK